MHGIKIPRHFNRFGTARSSIVEDSRSLRGITRDVCKILKNSTISRKKNTYTSFSLKSHSPLPFALAFTRVHALTHTLTRAHSRIFRLAISHQMQTLVVAELTEISTRSVVSSHSFSSLIPKPYNFYTWHTPNMAGRQSLYLITL